jgi:predicted transcriptional regulator of viral defense system
MNSSNRLKILIDSGKTVFTPQDLRTLWEEGELNAKTNAVRMVTKGLILRISKGYYALNEQYNIYELANRMVTPSYVSFQSALTYAGVGFQVRNQIDCAARVNGRKKRGAILYVYYVLKDDLFFNLDGIRIKEGISIASPERAILDSLYLGFLPDIDDASKINVTALKRLSALYPKTVQKKAEKFI